MKTMILSMMLLFVGGALPYAQADSKVVSVSRLGPNLHILDIQASYPVCSENESITLRGFSIQHDPKFGRNTGALELNIAGERPTISCHNVYFVEALVSLRLYSADIADNIFNGDTLGGLTQLLPGRRYPLSINGDRIGFLKVEEKGGTLSFTATGSAGARPENGSGGNEASLAVGI